MPSVTHDGRSFLVDGRRIWLVSGRIPYARLPRETWADRIHQAKLAGLNTVETPVFWARHEPRPGRFDFTGDNDLRHFVDLVGKAGMMCILGLGPYVGAAWDMGGLPPWLTGKSLRTNSGPYLEACSRFFSAIADQIKGWQVTAPGTGGPIVLLQCENGWTCGHDVIAAGYLGELTRYIREAGLNVPLVNANNLWQSVEGQVDGWSGDGPMLGTMRQLAAVRPGSPRVVIDHAFSPFDTWGKPAAPSPSPTDVLRRLCEISAGGGQFNISTFAGGTNFGFSGGRLASAPDAMVTTSASAGCVLDEAGRPAETFHAVRRVAHAASRFARVFANLDPSFQPITVDPGSESARPAGTCAVVHAVGAQGGVAFVFGDDPAAASSVVRTVPLLLPDGTTLTVPVAASGVAWCFFGVSVGGRFRLDYSNLSAMGYVGQTLVVFGPKGARAMLSVNGSPVEASVPTGASPAVLEHEGLTIAILSEEQADTTFLGESAVFVGVAGLTASGAPIALPGQRGCVRISGDGQQKTIHIDTPARKAAKLSLASWATAGCETYLDGTSARFAAISGPADLTALGSPYGYGWFRLNVPSTAAKRVQVMFPSAADRLHVYQNARPVGVVGVGPGAGVNLGLGLKRGDNALVMMVENAGRVSEGVNLGGPKGLYGEAFAVAPLKTPKPFIEVGKPVDVLAFRAPLWEVSEGDTTSPDRLTWKLAHRKRTPLIMHMPTPPAGALLMVADKPIAFVDRSGPTQIVLDGELFSRGALVQLALVAHGESETELETLARSVKFYEAIQPMLAEASLAFAKWEPPAASAFAAPGKGAKLAPGQPRWWRSTFAADTSGGPVFFEPAGLTKGQFYLNGRHVGRYFVATGAGKKVGPQDRYLLPTSWMKPGENELMVFDEHGASPARARLAH